MKRSAAEAGLGGSIKQAPAGTSGQGPWVVHFPSGFNPEGDVACEWESYAHSERRNQHVLVARGVSGAESAHGAGASKAPPAACRCRQPPLATQPACLPAPLVRLQASDDVDFVGSTSSADYSSALPCR